MTRDILAATIVAFAALVPRIWMVSSLVAPGLVADMLDYFDRARFLLENGRLYPDAFRVPAYPIAIAGFFAALGPGLQSVRILQCLVITLLALATYVLARGAMGPGRAVAAGLIVAWYPGLLLYTMYVMAEPLFTLLVLLAVICALGEPDVRKMLGAGLVAGLAALTRQAGVAVAAALVLWGAFGPGVTWGRHIDAKRRAFLALGVAAGFALALAPWTARNYAVFGRWMPLETTGGITFLMSNYEDATGRYLLSDWEAVHRRYLNRQPEEFTRNAVAYRLGLQYIANDPVRILELLPRRLGYLFDLEGREHLWLYTSSYFGAWPRAVVLGVGWAVALSFPVLVIAAIVSLAFGPGLRTRTEAVVVWVLAVMIVQLVTVFGDPRFHLPLVPLLAIIAVRPWSVKDSRRSFRRGTAGVIVLVIALSWWGARLPTQLRSIEQAASPTGWQSAMPY